MADSLTDDAGSTGPIRRARASLAALETLQRLRRTPSTAPSAEDLAALRGWSGWGPLAPAFELDRTGTWRQIGERIAFLLPDDDYEHGIQATYNAFYTPPEITAACWGILTGLGFTGGRVLEPGCGAGAFMSATPAGLSTNWVGVERDPTTAAIATLLHPSATIHNRRLEETALPSYAMDAVLGNVPFGETKVYDPTAPRELTANLHNYFIHRAVQALRPGGVAVLITSRYTLDAASENAHRARMLISAEAELLGAIRLPNEAMTSGGTEALVDVLVLRRRRPGDMSQPSDGPAWLATGPAVGGQQVNSYFLANPHMVLGELAEDRAPRWGRTLRVDPRPGDPPVAIAMAEAGREIVRQALETGRGWAVETGPGPITAETFPFTQRADGKKEGSFHLVDGVVHEVVDGALTPVARAGKELPKLVALRDAVLALLDAEADHARPDADLEPLRAEANRLYDAYVAAHGFLNRYTVIEGKPDADGTVTSSRRRPSMGGFRRDPDFVTVLALEDFDDDTRTASKAALLTRRVNRPRQRATRAETPAEAIALCRDELGRFDAARVTELLGIDPAHTGEALAQVAFIDPETDAWVPADEYLTGNVRAKLAHATAAAALDPDRYARNIPALEAVVPKDLEPEQIEANLGAPWIPATDVRDFATELLGFRVQVWHEPRTHTWSVTTSRRAQESAAATSDWGTFRLNAYQLLEYGLNGKAPVVYDVVDDARVRNQDETIAANDRLDAIAARFADWWREDPDRADRLARAYNHAFNAVVPRRHDGSHLTFPGLDAGFTPYPHQRDMVARMISGTDALCPYPVGTGKTATMFMAAIKLKALGLAAKPLIIVVPSTLEQIARDGKRLFPNARILMAGKDDLATPRARKLFAARCAMGEWDAVVMSHPSFTSLPVHPSVEADYTAALAADYRSALIQAKTEHAEPRKIKQIAKLVDNLEARAKTLLRHATDDGVFFEHLGADYLLVDEMHYFKNLGVPVHTDGFAINGSKRAQDLDMKLGYLRARHPGQAVVTGFTGTPVSNTLLELFILQHYLQPHRLDELGLASADAWASSFVRFATGVEITPDGGFRLNRRPVEIINVPDLMHTVAEFAELRPPETFPVTRPAAHRHLVVVEASDTVRDYVHDLADRADEIRAGGVPPSEDNMLKICSDGRKVALHESLVGLEPEGPGKIGAVAANVARIHRQTASLPLPGDERGVTGRLQLVFCDLGTPSKDKGPQVYGLLRRQLIDAGVPAAGIRFIHDAATDAQRMALFDQCNKGYVNVLIGSTDKLGVGVNVQRRAIALHHIDAPWRPDQVEQREGRVWRPKNLNDEVEIYRYVTRDSFDAFMWQTLERKEKALRPILAGQVTARTVEDIGDVALDYGQIKAVATGNPLLAELGELNVKIKSLSSLAASHQRTQRRLRADIHTLAMQAAAAEKTAEVLEAVAKHAAAVGGARSGSPWLNADLLPLTADDAANVLGTLAESTIATGYCGSQVHWGESLAIDFTYAKTRHDGTLAARIITDDRHRTDAPLNLAWAAKGQHWRIRDSIHTTITNAGQTAEETREAIKTLNQRIRENEAAIGQPFAEQAALDELRARRVVLDAAIREKAQQDEEARRKRAARGVLGAPREHEHDRTALLQQLHSAMTTMIREREAELVATAEAADVSAVVNPIPATDLPSVIDVEDPRADITPTDIPQAAARPIEPRTSSTVEPANAGAAPTDPSAPDPEATLTLEPVAELISTSDLEDPRENITPANVASATPRTLERSKPESSQPGQLEAITDAPSAAASRPDAAIAPASVPESTNIVEPEDVGLDIAIPELPISSAEPADVPLSESTEPAEDADETTDAPDIPDQPDYEQLYAEQFAPDPALESPEPEPSTTATETTSAPDQPAARPRVDTPSSSQRPAMYEHAIDLALQGFAVFPLKPGTKRPMFKGWEKLATTDPEQITRWWNATPHANIAIACGPSNLLVIDLDTAKHSDGPRHGQHTLDRLAAGRELPATFTVASARGGRHLYFRQPQGAALRNTTGSETAGLGPLIDTRGHGGYVVAPGSVFNGATYRIERDAPVAELPTWITEHLAPRSATTDQPPPTPAPPRAPVTDRRRAAYANAALKRAAETVAGAREGTRNDTLNREAFRLGRLVGGGILDPNDATTALRRAAQTAGLPPHEAATTIASGLTAGVNHPRSLPDPAPRPWTDRHIKETDMATVTNHEPREATQQAATSQTSSAPAALEATASEAADTAAPALVTPPQPDALTADRTPSPAPNEPSSAHSRSAAAPEPAPAHEATTALDPDFNFDSDFEEIWNDVRASIERARQAIPDWTELDTPDDLKPAIEQARRHLAQTPIPRADTDPATANAPAATAAPAIEEPSDTLDQHLAAVDAAHAHAQAVGIPTDQPEWARITAIHSAVHNLWDTLKAAVGTYWAELSADARVRGLLTTLATRAARTIATLANTAATRLEQRGPQQQIVPEQREPALREAYINARSHIHAHAATHEWQRITALWGTVNTLTRQADDPGIRAVIARSAAALADYAASLAGKTAQPSDAPATDALTTLAAAAERHAAALRAADGRSATTPQPRPQLAQPAVTAPATQPATAATSTPSPQSTEAQQLQAKARQVAQRAQARLAQPPRPAVLTGQRPQNAATARGQASPTRPPQPSSTQPTPSVQIR